MKLVKVLVASAIILFSSTYVLADAIEDVTQLQANWAVANYSLKDDAQKNAFEVLLKQAETAVMANTESVDVLIWQGVIKASYAGIKGGLSALSLVKSAKVDFEKALTMDEMALQGSSYTNLGVLYYKVPGWPIGFGDDGKAKKYLDKALTIDSAGIENNYFYADYLIDQREYAQAESYLLKAQHAAVRPNRPIADKGRQAEITSALQGVAMKLKEKNKDKNNASITDRR